VSVLATTDMMLSAAIRPHSQSAAHKLNCWFTWHWWYMALQKVSEEVIKLVEAASGLPVAVHPAPNDHPGVDTDCPACRSGPLPATVAAILAI